ncbi:hypothetical protein PMALA_070010, partial [Plasmodium malariae]
MKDNVQNTDDSDEKKKGIFCSVHILETENEITNSNSKDDRVHTFCSDESSNVILHDMQEDELSSDLSKTLIRDVEIDNSKLQNKYQIICLHASENKYMNVRNNEHNQNIYCNSSNNNNNINSSNNNNNNSTNNDINNSNNINNENRNVVASNNLYSANDDIPRDRLNNEMDIKRNYNSENEILNNNHIGNHVSNDINTVYVNDPYVRDIRN